MPKRIKTTGLEVEEVVDAVPDTYTNTGELLFVVKLDSKRFEGRTLEQAMNLIHGSAGVVTRVTLERQ